MLSQAFIPQGIGRWCTLTSRSGFTIAVNLTAANLDGESQLQAAAKQKVHTMFETIIEKGYNDSTAITSNQRQWQ